MDILLAVLIGAAFGFALDRIGATNPGYIVGMLNLTRLHLMKTILLGVGLASILTFAGLLTGLVDPAHLSVKTAYLGVIVGGILLGAGFAVAGYCPGTGLAAMATGRIDAAFFVVGGLAGAFAYMLSYGWVKTTGILESFLGGATTIGKISGTKYPALVSAVSGELLGLFLGLVLVAVAFMLPDRIVRRTAARAAPAE